MKDGFRILQFVLSVIGRIYERPFMYGGDADGVELILWHYHQLQAEIVDRREEFDAVLESFTLNRQCCVMGSAGHYREHVRPEAPEDEVVRYVVAQWKAIDERLRIAVPAHRPEA